MITSGNRREAANERKIERNKGKCYGRMKMGEEKVGNE